MEWYTNMVPMSRLLRKTKAVVSPGKKEGETKEQYRLRYMAWWLAKNRANLPVVENLESISAISEKMRLKEVEKENGNLDSNT